MRIYLVSIIDEHNHKNPKAHLTKLFERFKMTNLSSYCNILLIGLVVLNFELHFHSIIGTLLSTFPSNTFMIPRKLHISHASILTMRVTNMLMTIFC